MPSSLSQNSTESFWRTAAAIAAIMAMVSAASNAQVASLPKPLLTRRAIPDSAIAEVAKSKLVSAVAATEKIQATVSLQPRDLPGLEAFAEAVSNPYSPSYKQFIAPKEVGDRFGATLEDRQAAASYLTSQGLTVKQISPNGMAISVEGPAASFTAAFGAKLAYYVGPDAEGKSISYRANATELTVPMSMTGLITNVSGLETHTRPKARVTTITPAQTTSAYGLSTSRNLGYTGLGRNVAISNFDGFSLTNLTSFITTYNIPYTGAKGSNVTVVTVGTGAMTGTAQGEGDLDIQMVVAQAPLSSVRVYDNGTNDLIGVLNLEASDNWADVISESYGWSLGTSTANSAHNIHLTMTAQGITYMAASGDSGTTITPYAYPDYDPEVLMVGGTIADVNPATGNRTSEIAWNFSGGGWYNSNTASITWNILPTWQVGTGVPTNVNRRLIPDIAFHAAANNNSNYSPGGYYFYTGGAQYTGDGTSFASPVFAGALTVIAGRLNQFGGRPVDNAHRPRLGRLQNLIYSFNGRSDIFNDITVGTNGKLPTSSTGTSNALNGATSSCTVGWDYVTGWGSMNMEGFYQAFFGGR